MAFRKEKDHSDKYLSGLKKSKKSFGDRIHSLSDHFRGVDDELLEEIMVILLESDVGIHTAQKIVDLFSERSKEIKNYDSMEDYFIAILKDFYNEDPSDIIHYNTEGPTVFLMVGVNGSGKTTTAAKLMQMYKDVEFNVAVAAADTFRAGAVDQIEEWANRIGVPCIKGKPNQDPSSVLVDACRYAKTNNIDILICDTAGRLQNKSNLMKELSKMNRVVAREIEGAPQEVWLVLDATTGQNGISQAKIFMEAVNVTGIILTKMDGTAKGGVVLAIRDQLHLPVRFLGLGEKPEDLCPFELDNYLMGITKGMDQNAE
ncbi:signal recognition particle-docking protein FtsY [Catenisphaera adipataccumulans]|jgi:fused signal recognition particle receptor|uniref:Signal recognition particle receptor FtsY n=1 Tax=Catenisphaera adipataccumulans TaxID=700500 RepID=A0A7W8FXM6_9FIRM|nr:signal recognition particle-docking protein FtsY [Catenisphaera adipataccumulans]MBB5183910.1 fused signal recognition particle receptor [Catenisphaera adipataccumulans]